VTSPRRGFAWTIVWREDQGQWKAANVHQSIAAPPATVTQAGRVTFREAPFRDALAKYATAVNKRDVDALVAMYTPTADQVIVDGPHVMGRDAIREAMLRQFAGWGKSQRFSLELSAARMVTPDVAIVDTKASFSEGPTRSDRGTWVMVRSGDKWLISSLRVYPAPVKK
jgi:uncharacterized protein (TIGR02246 family)